MRKKMMIAFMVLNPILLLIGWWIGELILVTWTAFAMVLHTYYHEQLEAFDEETVASATRQVDTKLVKGLGFLTLFAFFVIIWFFDETTVSLLDTIYVVAGIILAWRGLLIRRAVLTERIDWTNVTPIKKGPSS